VNTATAANRATAISDTPRQREHQPGTVNTSQPGSTRSAQSYVFTANDAFAFIFSVGGHDATYIWTDEGWCYLATVVDACSRRLLGWPVTDHLRTELCLDALLAAVAARGGRRQLAAGIVSHTDHGSSTPPGSSGPRAGRWTLPSPWAPSATAS
jgi:transposase InsO family protein